MVSRIAGRAWCWTWALATIVAVSVVATSREVQAQGVALQNQQSVGGVLVDAGGVLTHAKLEDRDRLARMRKQALESIDGSLEAPNPLRKISLRQLDAALDASIRSGKPLPDAMRYLAGLQTIRYVFVYPEQNDVVLAGFGEGWKVDAAGNIVGLSTGRPVLLLDDLLVALRATSAAPSVISCSIDPTPEGLQKLTNYSRSLTSMGSDPRRTLQNIERTLGPQTITVTGVPATSHLARVLVAADYRMKRLAMNFDPAPIAGLPSYLSMLQVSSRGQKEMLPRWWLAMDYQPLSRDDAGLAWELAGASVKAMSAEDRLRNDGTFERTGQTGGVTQQWAEIMTRKYNELAAQDPIFAELKNVMDVSVVAALIVRENLSAKAQLKLSTLLSAERLPNDAYAAPKQTPSIASALHKVGGWIISASGGVEISAWSAVERQQVRAEINDQRSSASPSKASSWWWN